MPVEFFRTFLLVMGVLALLSAMLPDGLMVRFFFQPFRRKMDALSQGKVQYPPGFLFMFEHAWARRLYNIVFASLVIGMWWYLGTPAGAALLASHR